MKHTVGTFVSVKISLSLLVKKYYFKVEQENRSLFEELFVNNKMNF
jgi:hypothetical protein